MMRRHWVLVRWDLDDARFTYCQNDDFDTKEEAIEEIYRECYEHKTELEKEYKNDDIVYDATIKQYVKLTFDEWIYNCIDNFCHFLPDTFYDEVEKI